MKRMGVYPWAQIRPTSPEHVRVFSPSVYDIIEWLLEWARDSSKSEGAYSLLRRDFLLCNKDKASQVIRPSPFCPPRLLSQDGRVWLDGRLAAGGAGGIGGVRDELTTPLSPLTLPPSVQTGLILFHSRRRAEVRHAISWCFGRKGKLVGRQQT
ncbi:unnamed protein product [Protopolystoma xenopodis]|uniref:Uncharacterized protein n=1 Tax=Protopolystoma xenopodis TaxID=117903 RepID=A0A3S5AD28_9PLAT|nr:unnamed protein product [Protopolystoma xenopodis]